MRVAGERTQRSLGIGHLFVESGPSLLEGAKVVVAKGVSPAEQPRATDVQMAHGRTVAEGNAFQIAHEGEVGHEHGLLASARIGLGNCELRFGDGLVGARQMA